MHILIILCVIAAIIFFGIAAFNVSGPRFNPAYAGWTALAVAALLTLLPA